MPPLGKSLIIAGLALLVLGLLVVAGDKLPIKLGQLPGDLVWRGKNSTVYFPLATCLLLSLIGSFILWLIQRR
jgi:hypothetical protein